MLISCKQMCLFTPILLYCMIYESDITLHVSNRINKEICRFVSHICLHLTRDLEILQNLEMNLLCHNFSKTF